VGDLIANGLDWYLNQYPPIRIELRIRISIFSSVAFNTPQKVKNGPNFFAYFLPNLYLGQFLKIKGQEFFFKLQFIFA
jgi:hypothetical protein